MGENFTWIRELSETRKQTLPVPGESVCTVFRKYLEVTAAVENERMSEPAGALETVSCEPVILPVGKLSLHMQQ